MRLWPRPFFVAPDDLEALRVAADGSTRYRWHDYEFTITRLGLSVLSTWWCYQGFHRPGELLSHSHEAGWGSFSHAACLRKVLRAVRSVSAEEMRDGALNDEQADARTARTRGMA